MHWFRGAAWLMTNVRSGRIQVEPSPTGVGVQFDLQLTELTVLFAATLALLAATLVMDDSAWRLVAQTAVLSGAFYLGLGYLIAHLRVASVLRSIAKRIREVDVEVDAG
jgi:hypothetical protein